MVYNCGLKQEAMASRSNLKCCVILLKFKIIIQKNLFQLLINIVFILKLVYFLKLHF